MHRPEQNSFPDGDRTPSKGVGRKTRQLVGAMMVSRRSTLLLALLCTACADTTANDADREPGLAEIDSSTSRIEEVAISPGLAQRVRLTPAEPTPGSLFRVQSTIVNRSSNDIALESRICGLTLGGTLRLEHP